LSSTTSTSPPNGRSQSGSRGSVTDSHSPTSGRSDGVTQERNVPKNVGTSGRPTANGNLVGTSAQVFTDSETASTYGGGTEITPPSGVDTPSTSRTVPSHEGRVRSADPTMVTGAVGGQVPSQLRRNWARLDRCSTSAMPTHYPDRLWPGSSSAG